MIRLNVFQLNFKIFNKYENWKNAILPLSLNFIGITFMRKNDHNKFNHFLKRTFLMILFVNFKTFSKKLNY